jgi:cob(I)alamin adenosyltransferase
MKIYTRTGDDGSTGLFGGDRVQKNHPRIRAYGTVDEVNAVLGTAIAQMHGEKIYDSLRISLLQIQRDLFVLGADLATPIESRASVPRIEETDISALEQIIDEMEIELPSLAHFILPGGHPTAAALHLARTTCRRAERDVVEALEREKLSLLTLKYLNRLSDLLFVAARLANQLSGVPDLIWKGKT